MHLGSPILTTDPYEQAAKKALEVVTDLRKAGHQTNWVNLGGGFGLSYKGEEAPPASDYAKVILPYIKEAKCRLALEPGRSICGNAGVLIGKVIYTKREGGKRFIIQDAAMNDLVRPAMYDAYHELVPLLRDSARPSIKADLVGPICESGDCFAKDRVVQEVGEGEYVAFLSAGAYGYTMASRYNTRGMAAEVLVSGGRFELVNARESFETMTAGEKIPGFLKT
jgi:diaminopimelate decarboxylase